MGLLDELKRIARPYEDEEEDYDDFDAMGTGRLDRSEIRAKAARPDNAGFFDSDRPERAERVERRNNKVVNIHTTTQLQVVLVKPEKFENAAEIADHLREKRTVVLNMEETSKDVSRRILDFLSGAAYAQEGKVKKVAVSTYIITPYNVDILGNLLDELEDNGLYF